MTQTPAPRPKKIPGTYLDAVLLLAVLALGLAAGMDWRKFFELANSRAGAIVLVGFFVLVIAKVAKRVLARVGPSGVELEVDRRETNGDDIRGVDYKW